MILLAPYLTTLFLFVNPSPSLESGGTYARSPSPEPPYLRYWLSREIFLRLRPQNTPFPKKMGTRLRPPYAFESGGGGGGGQAVNSSPFKFLSSPPRWRETKGSKLRPFVYPPSVVRWLVVTP